MEEAGGLLTVTRPVMQLGWQCDGKRRHGNLANLVKTNLHYMENNTMGKQMTWRWLVGIMLIGAFTMVRPALAAGEPMPQTVETQNLAVHLGQEIEFALRHDGKVIPLGQLRLQGAAGNWVTVISRGQLQKIEKQSDGVEALYAVSSKIGDAKALQVTAHTKGDQITLTWRFDGAEQLSVPDKCRMIWQYPKEGKWKRPQDRSTQKLDDGSQQIQLDYGPFVLLLEFEQGMVGWTGGPSGYLGMNLTDQGWQAMTSKGLTFSARIVPADLSDRRRTVFRRIADAEAYLEAIRIWELATADDAWMKQQTQCLANVKHELGLVDITAAQTGDPDDEQDITTPMSKEGAEFSDDGELPMGGWKQLVSVTHALDDCEAQIQSFLESHRGELFAKAKKVNERMSYGVGLGYDHNPQDRLLKWATFNMAFFRCGQGRFRGDTPEQQYQMIHEALAEADRYGARCILLVGGGDGAQIPEDLTYTDQFLPRLRPSFYRYNFNSKRIRDAVYNDLKQTGAALKDIPNVAVYQVKNEPFWSTRPNPILGYNPAEIGCSNETWQQQIRKKYGNDEAWAAAVNEQLKQMEANGKTKRRFADHQVAPAMPARSIDKVVFDPAKIEGLTLVKFLQNRYGTLDKLNHAWFADDRDRYFASWDRVFPPLPLHGQTEDRDLNIEQTGIDFPAEWLDAEESMRYVRPAPRDIAAWVDWAEFWAHCVNDAQRSHRQALVDSGVTVPISTNAIMGHMLNGFGGNTADVGCSPWITMNGLDAMGIDFYSTSYLQGYMAALRDASDGRPIYIHEAEGPKSGYVAMYSFAYGASGLAIWRRDHNIAPRAAVQLLKVTRAMADRDLQFHSQPVTDGVAILYSLDSMYLMDAITGSGADYLQNVQCGIYLMNRLQVLFNLYADRQFAEGVPDHVKVLFAPGVLGLTDQTIDALHQYVDRGGILITDPSFGRYDRHGRKRDAATLRWLEENDHVIMLAEGAASEWRQSIHGSDHSPRRWATGELPTFSPAIEQAIDVHAPRTVTYRNPQKPNELPIRAPGARRSEDGKLFVFVDPWSGPTRLEVRGRFTKATNLYDNQPLEIDSSQHGMTCVTVAKGPAVVRFDP